ncbi:MAG: 4-alpha-glucanotransferase, partial [Pseudomonadota bacterium]
AEQQKRFDAAMLGEREAPTGRAAFEAFRAAGGAALEAFALFEALSLVHGPDWRYWPAGLENPDTEAARAFATAHPAEVAFHAWLQMEADRALASAQASARQAGMPLGLYADLAVGVRPGGAETWARQGGDAGAIFARGVSLGAPPDMFSTEGQSWGLAPFSPPGLAADDFAAFAETLRATMRHAGMIRVDHILGLERTFWVPEDGTPGGYVASDTDALFAILRLEAAQNGCLVVGEDLGVVPDGLRPRMADNGIYGSAIAMFEHWEGQLRAPWHYGTETLASFGTHDTATLAGWWCGHDIDLRLDLGLTNAEDAATLHRARAGDRLTLMALLAEAWILPEGIDRDAPPDQITPELIGAIHRLLARAPSALVAAQLDDVLGTLEQPNLPGTIDGHPNWCRRHAAAVEDLAANPAVHGISSIMRQEGRG